MEQDWLYGPWCLQGGKHEETHERTYNANHHIIFCKKCGEYLFTESPTQLPKSRNGEP